jgi:2'-5' RNA ligase
LEHSSKKLYFIALVPPIDLRDQVRLLKEEMRDRFGAGHALKSPAHITLQMPFRWPEKEEARLIGFLDTFRLDRHPFPVLLNGFDCFAPRVIFIKVLNHRPIVDLATSLKLGLERVLGFRSKQVHHGFHPHLTIATRDLSEEAFSKAWPEYAERPFQANFLCYALSLLKHNGKCWEIHQSFTFPE